MIVSIDLKCSVCNVSKKVVLSNTVNHPEASVKCGCGREIQVTLVKVGGGGSFPVEEKQKAGD